MRYKIQEFITRGGIDDLSLLKVKTPLWEFLEAPTHSSKAAGVKLVKDELIEIHAEGKPALEMMKNPAAIYMEGFRSAKDI